MDMTGRTWRCRGMWAALALLGCLILSAPAQATTTLGQGNQPEAVTDVDGITYVAWDHSTPGSNDSVQYCRVLRLSTTCDAVQTLVLPASCVKYDTKYSGFPQGDHPKVMVSRFGDVRVVTHASCTPSGNLTYPYRDVTIVYTSTDGGMTFGAPALGLSRADPFRADFGYAGAATNDESDVLYDDADSRIVVAESNVDSNAGPQATGSGIFILGGTSDADGRLSSGYDAVPTIAQRGRGSFAVSWLRRTDNTVHLRTFDCAECALGALSTATNWSAEQVLPDTEQADNPKVVSGPAGAFIIYYSSYRATPDDPQGAWFVRRITGATVGPRQLVLAASKAGDLRVSQLGTAAEDPATGRLHVVFSRTPVNSSFPNVLTHVSSDDGGATWSAMRDTTTMQVNYKPEITADTGDDGFIGMAFTGEQTQPAQIYSNYPITADKLPGWGDPPGPIVPNPGGGGGGGGGTTGGGTGGPTGGPTSPAAAPNATPDACRVKQFGPLEILGQACLEVTKEGVIIAKGSVKVNGLTLAGKEIHFDPKKRIVDSLGNSVTFTLGDTKLFSIPIDWKIPAGSTFTLPSIALPSSAGKLFGFPLQGSVDVKLIHGGVEIPVHLGLPALFGGFSGDVTVRADNLVGIRVRELKVKAGKALIGPLELDDLTFEYNPDDKHWAGGATLLIPPKPPAPSLESHVSFTGGELDYLRNELTFAGEGIPLDNVKLTHLTKIRFALELKPALKLTGGVTFSAGQKFGDTPTAEIDGDLSFTFPSGAPAILRADGTVKLLSIPVGGAYMQFKTDGQVNFGGHIDYSLSEFGVHAQIDGWILPPKAFSVYGKARVCLGDLGCDSGDVVVSSTGMAACAYTKIADFGAGYKWGPSLLWSPAILFDIDYMWHGCSVSEYQPAAPSAAQAGVRVVQIEPGLPSAVVGVVGTNAVPHVVLVGPKGERIEPPVSGPLKTARAIAFHVASEKTTFFAIKKPSPGAWKIEPLADNATPIASVGHAAGLPKPVVKAAVSGKGRKRALTYKIAPAKGQKVRFEERGKGTGGVIGTARGTAGTLNFAPAIGPKGRRRIVAVVESFGLPRTQLDVATYTAPPPPKPVKPAKLKLGRSGSRLLISWRGQAGLSRYRLTAKLTDGRVLLLLPGGGRTAATVPAFGKKVRATVSLQGEFRDGTTGPLARATLR